MKIEMKNKDIANSMHTDTKTFEYRRENCTYCSFFNRGINVGN